MAEAEDELEDQPMAEEEPEPPKDQPMAEEEPEPPKELETDAPVAQPFLKAGQCCFLTEDTTFNVLPTVNGKLLTALGEGGFQYLMAGARANVGIKAGRYFFEVMIAEAQSFFEPRGRTQGPEPRQVVRVGVSTAQSSLLLSVDHTESVCFDSSGFFQHGGERQLISKKFGHSQVAGLLVNLDPKSPNANTVSLFVDGERVSQPQPIPESMKGKALFPTVNFRNVVLQVHFGAQPLRSLAFACHSWLQVHKAHSEVKGATSPADGKYEVLLPVGLPDEGTFDWVDQFLSKNRNYTELSDRAILDWAKKSGLQRYGGYARRSSNDHPEMDFGLPLMEDASVHRVIQALATMLPRNFIIPEVKGNLSAEDRRILLASFPSHCYKKVAKVIIGEPPADYKTFMQQAWLKDKKAKAEAELMRKKAEAARKKEEEAHRKAQEEQKKADNSKEAEAEGAEGESKEDGKEKGEEEEKDAKDEDAMEEEVLVNLTEEEKKRWFRPTDSPDLTSKEMSSSYQKFTLPSKEEGCDEITFLWHKEAQSKDYLNKWVQERKKVQRVDDLQPSDWFRNKFTEWNRVLGAWRKLQSDFKDPSRRRALAMAKKAQEGKAKKAVEEEKKDKQAEEENGDDEPKEEKEEQEEKEEKVEVAEEEEEEMKIDAESLDPLAVEDVTDFGNGEPLFANFQHEDWTLMSLRFELHLLCHAFQHDLDDPERPTFKEEHLAYYYNKYFRRVLSLNYYGVESNSELIDLVKDSVELSPSMSIEPQLSSDSPLENFVRLTEDGRRDRQLRIDSGDETAMLKIQRPRSPGPPVQGNFGKGGPGKGVPFRQTPPPTGPGGRPFFGYGAGGRPALAAQPPAHRPAPRPPATAVTFAQKRAVAQSNYPPAKTQRTSYPAGPTSIGGGAAAPRYGRSSYGLKTGRI